MAGCAALLPSSLARSRSLALTARSLWPTCADQDARTDDHDAVAHHDGSGATTDDAAPATTDDRRTNDDDHNGHGTTTTTATAATGAPIPPPASGASQPLDPSLLGGTPIPTIAIDHDVRDERPAARDPHADDGEPTPRRRSCTSQGLAPPGVDDGPRDRRLARVARRAARLRRRPARPAMEAPRTMTDTNADELDRPPRSTAQPPSCAMHRRASPRRWLRVVRRRVRGCRRRHPGAARRGSVRARSRAVDRDDERSHARRRPRTAAANRSRTPRSPSKHRLLASRVIASAFVRRGSASSTSSRS